MFNSLAMSLMVTGGFFIYNKVYPQGEERN
jgi:hypothetical protein